MKFKAQVSFEFEFELTADQLVKNPNLTLQELAKQKAWEDDIITSFNESVDHKVVVTTAPTRNNMITI